MNGVYIVKCVLGISGVVFDNIIMQYENSEKIKQLSQFYRFNFNIV